MADYQTIAGTDTVNAALLTKAVNNFVCAQNECAGATAPASPIAHQTWVDTSGSPVVVKRRNAANSAWVTQVPDVSATGGGLLPLTGGTMTGALSFGGTQKVTNLAAATSSGDAVSKTQIDSAVQVATVPIGTLSATDNKYLFIAGTGVHVISDVVIVSELGVASSGTDYWTFVVQNLTAAVALKAVAKTTNGSALTANAAYAFGLDQNLTLASGDVLQLQATKTGSPNALTECLAVVRYKVTL